MFQIVFDLIATWFSHLTHFIVLGSSFLVKRLEMDTKFNPENLGSDLELTIAVFLGLNLLIELVRAFYKVYYFARFKECNSYSHSSLLNPGHMENSTKNGGKPLDGILKESQSPRGKSKVRPSGDNNKSNLKSLDLLAARKSQPGSSNKLSLTGRAKKVDMTRMNGSGSQMRNNSSKLASLNDVGLEKWKKMANKRRT
jgi:hypothetical protein